MFTNFRLTAMPVAAITATLFLCGCNGQADHPNQINAFDGACYDSLTLAHGALADLSSILPSQYPQYSTMFNQAVAAYSVAFEAYSAYRAAPTSQLQMNTAILALTQAIVDLENTFQADLHVSATNVEAIELRAAKIRRAAKPDTSTVDILTELEVAAAVAETVTDAQYAQLAAVVIGATDAGLAAEEAEAGQPIDLSTIQPIAPIQ